MGVARGGALREMPLSLSLTPVPLHGLTRPSSKHGSQHSQDKTAADDEHAAKHRQSLTPLSPNGDRGGSSSCFQANEDGAQSATRIYHCSMGLYPFFRNKQVADGRCSFCNRETPADFRKPDDTDESTVKKAMQWYEVHRCQPLQSEHGREDVDSS